MFVLLSIASLLSTNRRSVSYPRCGFESFNPKNLILLMLMEKRRKKKGKRKKKKHS